MRQTVIKSAMQNGLIMGGIFALNFIFAVSQITILSYLSNITPILILYITFRMVVHYRENERKGAISYGQSLRYIVLLFFYGSLISTMSKYIYLTYLNPNLLETISQDFMRIYTAMKYSMKDYSDNQIENELTPLNFSLMFIYMNLFIAVIVGTIMSAFVKKDKNVFEA